MVAKATLTISSHFVAEMSRSQLSDVVVKQALKGDKMSIEVEKKIMDTSNGPVSDQVSQTSTSTVAQVPTVSEVKDAEADRGNAWIWYIVGIIDLLLVLRLAFYLFGAKAVGFADLLYSITNPLVAPFRGIFSSPNVEGSYFDMTAITAIVVYALLGWVISRLIDLVTRPNNSKKI